MQTSNGERIEIKNGVLSAAIDCRGAQLRSLKKNGTELIWQGDSEIWGESAPILFPICGGLRDDRYKLNGKEYFLEKHGFACKLDFTGKKLSDNSASFVLTSNPQTLEKYPYEFTLTVTYTLADNTLKVEYAVENRNPTDMYYSVGSHEGYICDGGIEACKLTFDKTECFDTCVLDGGILGHEKQKLVPDGKELWLKDEYFTVDAIILEKVNSDSVTLCDSSNGRMVTVGFEGFENLLIWTKPGAKLVCIEPWSGFPDYSDTDGDFTAKNAIQKISPFETSVKVHTITV